MSTGLLYHGFGVRGYRHVKTQYIAGGIVILIVRNPGTCCCVACGSGNVWRQGVVVRKFKTVPIGKKPVTLVAQIPRLACQDCGVIRQASIDFARPRKSYTKAFERYALDLSRYMTIKDVACHLGISWDVIKEIQKKHLEKRFAKPKVKHLKKIAIDEISVGKGHQYLTVVMDLESGAIVHVGKGKGGDALTFFWKRLRSGGAKIEAVATDMSPAYIGAVTTYLPNATLVFDRFHVIKLYNEKLSQLRRAMHRELTDTMQKDSLKVTFPTKSGQQKLFFTY